MRPFIVMGDPTDHGGVGVGSTATTDTHGKRIARVGDQVTCPKKGHGTTVIVTGDPTLIIDGQPAARHGDKCACGATLISSQAVSRVGEGGGGGSPSQAPASAAKVASATSSGGLLSRLLPPSEDATHDLHFLVKDDLIGKPLPDVPYRLTLTNGTAVTGKTNEQGLTEKISADGAQIAKIEVPYYGDTASSAYSHCGYDTCGC